MPKIIYLDDLAGRVEKLLEKLPANRIPLLNDRRMFITPLVGAQKGDHPVFSKLREMMPVHRMPSQIFKEVYPAEKTDALSVIAFVFPINPETIKENAREKKDPSYSWLFTRKASDTLLPLVAEQLIQQLAQDNIKAVFVQKSAPYKVLQENNMPLYANWSERHMAYACGLGTFGLHRGLITAKGAAHRLMSLVVNAPCDLYGVVAHSHFADCLFLTKQQCGACIKRCPAQAIGPDGHNLKKCREYSYGRMQAVSLEKIGQATGGCALCMTGVPCAERNPVEKKE